MSRISELAKDYMDFVTDESNQAIIKNLIQAADDNATNDNFHCNQNDLAIIRAFEDAYDKIKNSPLFPAPTESVLSTPVETSTQKQPQKDVLSKLETFISDATAFLHLQSIKLQHDKQLQAMTAHNDKMLFFMHPDFPGNIVSYLSMRDVRSLLVTCRQSAFHSFFRPKLERGKDMQWLKEADYEKADKLINIRPDCNWMFEQAALEMEHEIEFLSPLQLACKVYDVLMCRIFLEAIKTKGPHEFKPLLTCFNAQINASIDYINLDLALGPSGAYAEYIKKCDLWQNDHLTDEELDVAWLALGKSQRKYLPRHMLKVVCDKNTVWGNTSEFTIEVTSRPPPCKLFAYYDKFNGKYVPLNFAELGSKFTVVRAQGLACAGMGRAGHAPKGNAARHNFAAFSRLFAVRREGLENLKAEIKDQLKSKEETNVSPSFSFGS